MNRYFIRGEGRRGYPEKVYARVDQIEPVNRETAETVTIALDAIDASWTGFRADGMFNLEQAEDNANAIAAHWQSRFRGDTRGGSATFAANFDELPLYQLEMTLSAHDPLSALLREGPDWFEFALGPIGRVEVDVYGGLFSEPASASIKDDPVSAVPSAALNLLFDMDSWPDATQSELTTVLNRGCSVEQLVVLDIGQGSAAAIVCPCGKVRYYFDAGCGVYRNLKTNPPQIEFCVCDDPPVILSHWDSDHWAGAFMDRDLLMRTWIVPRQKIGPKHVTFANAILAAGGKLLVVSHAPTSVRWGAMQSFDLRRCTGAPYDRNGSGLVLVVEDQASGRGWLLTGDAPYHLIPGPLPSDLAAVIVPHHGADMGSKSIPPTCPPHTYTRLLYSFGPGNVHGKTHVQHPTVAAVAAHQSVGWPHGAWSTMTPPGCCIAGMSVLATATHPNTHQGGAMAGWTAPPQAFNLHTGCSKHMLVTQS